MSDEVVERVTVPERVHVRGDKALVVMSNGDSFMAPVVDTVECGACGTRIPAIRTKAQQKPDSPEMLARIEHVRNCPSRVSASAGTNALGVVNEGPESCPDCSDLGIVPGVGLSYGGDAEPDMEPCRNPIHDDNPSRGGDA